MIEGLMTTKGTLRICPKGHKYYKSTDCPTCPVCESKLKTNNELLDALSTPARRAFKKEGITTLIKLAKYSEEEILKLHGVGPSTLPVLKKLLKKKNLILKNRITL